VRDFRTIHSKGHTVSQSAFHVAEERDPQHDSVDGHGLFARPVRFVRQVIGEIKRVVTPSREEWRRYTIVVTVFVLVIVFIVTVFDFGFGKLVEKVLG
jgi:preprotein translocase subunit SecE